MSKHYELMCIFPGTLAEDELPGLVEKVTKTIEEVGGEHIHAETVEKNRLAYPMKHIRYGYFSLIHFQMESEKLPTLQQKLRLMSGLLRTMINTYDPSMKQALEDRLSEIKRRIENRVGMEPVAEDAEEKEEKAERKPAKKEEKKEKEAIVEEKAKTEKTPAQEDEKADEKKEEKVDMQDIDKKLDALLDDTVSSL